jgi:hypothetical protein
LFKTANKKNKLTFIAEPLDDGLAEKLEAGKVNLKWENRKVRLLLSVSIFTIIFMSHPSVSPLLVGEILSN